MMDKIQWEKKIIGCNEIVYTGGRNNKFHITKTKYDCYRSFCMDCADTIAISETLKEAKEAFETHKQIIH